MTAPQDEGAGQGWWRVELPVTVDVWARSEDEAYKRAALAVCGYRWRRLLSWHLRRLRPRWMGTIEAVSGFGSKVERLTR